MATGAGLFAVCALLSLDAMAEPCRLRGALPAGAVLASWYGPEHHGRPTASGEIFDEHALTAAHPSLPLGTVIQVTDLVNGRSVQVRVTDRGPGHGRGLDLSQRAAELLGMKLCGLAPVRWLAVWTNRPPAAPCRKKIIVTADRAP